MVNVSAVEMAMSPVVVVVTPPFPLPAAGAAPRVRPSPRPRPVRRFKIDHILVVLAVILGRTDAPAGEGLLQLVTVVFTLFFFSSSSVHRLGYRSWTGKKNDRVPVVVAGGSFAAKQPPGEGLEGDTFRQTVLLLWNRQRRRPRLLVLRVGRRERDVLRQRGHDLNVVMVAAGRRQSRVRHLAFDGASRPKAVDVVAVGALAEHGRARRRPERGDGRGLGQGERGRTGQGGDLVVVVVRHRPAPDLVRPGAADLDYPEAASPHVQIVHGVHLCLRKISAEV